MSGRSGFDLCTSAVCAAVEVIRKSELILLCHLQITYSSSFHSYSGEVMQIWMSKYTFIILPSFPSLSSTISSIPHDGIFASRCPVMSENEKLVFSSGLSVLSGGGASKYAWLRARRWEASYPHRTFLELLKVKSQSFISNATLMERLAAAAQLIAHERCSVDDLLCVIRAS